MGWLAAIGALYLASKKQKQQPRPLGSCCNGKR